MKAQLIWSVREAVAAGERSNEDKCIVKLLWTKAALSLSIIYIT